MKTVTFSSAVVRAVAVRSASQPHRQPHKLKPLVCLGLCGWCGLCGCFRFLSEGP
jgi:hypothetical protein